MAVVADCAAMAFFACKAEAVVRASRLVLAGRSCTQDSWQIRASAVKSMDPLALVRHGRLRCNLWDSVRVFQLHGRRRRRRKRFGIASEVIFVNRLVLFLESGMNRVILEHIIH